MKGRRRMTALLLVMIFVMNPMGTTTVESATAIRVVLNNKAITYNETYGFPYIDSNDRTLVPLRLTLENFGASVEWDAKNRVAIASKNGIEVKVPIGERYILRNSEVIMMDTQAIIKGSRTYLPIRYVLEALGATVTWNKSTLTIDVKYSTVGTINRIPSSYDLRLRQKVSSVKDQLTIGACWAFATLGAMESTLLPGENFDFSEDHLSLNHGYKLSQNEGGDFQIALAYLARWSGPVLEADDPYGDKVTNTSLKAVKHVQEAILLPSKDYLAIKRAILVHGGVQTAIRIQDIARRQFGDSYYNASKAAFYYNGTLSANHDVVIVGWDDTYSRDNFSIRPSRDGAFICKNSYGTSFGENGYFYVSYDDTVIGRENIVYTKIESPRNYDNIYQSDWLGWIGRIGYGKPTAYFANVYNAKKAESLEAVSFYATDVNTSYEVYVVEKYQGVNDFKTMRFVTRGQLDYAGYYTIKFAQGIRVEGNYAVIVKVTTPNSSFPVAAEYQKDAAWIGTVNLSDGMGFMSYDGALWESTESLLKSNVCLKAFTKNIQ